MNCKSFDKGDVPCPEEATMTVFWPGKTTESCDRHYVGQLQIASAMGFILDARPIEKIDEQQNNRSVMGGPSEGR